MMTVHDLKPEITLEEIARLNKLRTYFEHFNVEQRYKMDFPEFVRRVQIGTWTAYLAG